VTINFLVLGVPDINVRLLSDTIALSLQLKEENGAKPRESEKNFLVGLISQIIKVLDLLIKDDRPLVLRGCISFGEHLSEGNFIAGPAVDEAAEYMNMAEGAFIWLLPSAQRRHSDLMDRTSQILNSLTPELFKDSFARLRERGLETGLSLTY
jgi:hypothetical protein